MGLGRHGGDLPNMARIRLLEETKGTSFDKLSSPSFIAWYCFLAFCVAVACVCCCWHCGRSRRQQYQLERVMARNEREETQQAELQVEISRIEANIKLFTEKHKIRRKNALMRTLKRQRVTVTAQHLALSANTSPGEDKSEQPVEDSHYDFASGCSICLESFVEGTNVMNSVDRRKCRHLFHEDCILPWLMSESDPQCPYCRQPFTDQNLSYETPPTSQSTASQSNSNGGSHGGSSGAFSDPRPDTESQNDTIDST